MLGFMLPVLNRDWKLDSLKDTCYMLAILLVVHSKKILIINVKVGIYFGLETDMCHVKSHLHHRCALWEPHVCLKNDSPGSLSFVCATILNAP